MRNNAVGKDGKEEGFDGEKQTRGGVTAPSFISRLSGAQYSGRRDFHCATGTLAIGAASPQ